MKSFESHESDELTIEKILEIKEGIPAADYKTLLRDRDYLELELNTIEDPRTLYIAITTSQEVEKSIYTFDDFHDTTKLKEWLKIMKNEAETNPDAVKSSLWDYLYRAVHNTNKSKAHIEDPETDYHEHVGYYKKYATILTSELFTEIIQFYKSLWGETPQKYITWLKEYNETYE